MLYGNSDKQLQYLCALAVLLQIICNYNYKYPKFKKTRQVKEKLGMIIVILKSYSYKYLIDCEYKDFLHI